MLMQSNPSVLYTIFTAKRNNHTSENKDAAQALKRVSDVHFGCQRMNFMSRLFAV